ncbi:MAG: hypothetical protein IT546_08155 [Caulobacteraceae bacterium]|nr:hypothetical protein [Caulobacteraceae bacterium]
MSDAGSTPVGMVDRLPAEPGGPTAEGLAFARAYLADGELDPALLARSGDCAVGSVRKQAA